MILELLHQGKAHATTAEELCRLTGIKQRELSRLIEAERRAGAPICSSTSSPPGYYIADTRRELERFGMSLYRRAGEIMKTARACQRVAASLPDRDTPGE